MPNFIPVQIQFLQTGDLIFASGNSLINRAIKYFSKSNYSHVGMIFILEDKPFVIEAYEGAGVRLVPLNHYYENYNGSFEIYSVPFDFDIRLLLNAGMSELGDPYSYMDILRILQRLIFGGNDLPETKGWICSEFVEFLLNCGGFQIESENILTPGDLYNILYEGNWLKRCV